MTGRLGRQRREVARLAARVARDDADARAAAASLNGAMRRRLASPAGLLACFAGGLATGLAAPLVGRVASANLVRGLGLSTTLLLRGLLRQVVRNIALGTASSAAPPGRTPQQQP